MKPHRRWVVGRRMALAIGGAMTLVLAMAAPVRANLAGSNFEGNDGNLVVNTTGNTDWVNAPNRIRGDDLPSGKNDNSFGQGTKEDDPVVSVVTGAIPPKKSDLTRFYVASEFAGNSNFLYLAWERSNVLGSANVEFEINKSTQPDLTTTGTKTLNRSAGDLLITFDFTNGGNPVLGLLKWVTSGPTTQCFSANALPCWGNRVDLSAMGEAEGAVNTVDVTDPIAGVPLPALTFGEAAVNLAAAGVFPAGTCVAFGSTFLKSRSSASFRAAVKDFVAPQPVNISNCGKISIGKLVDPRGTNQDFDFTSTIPDSAHCTPDPTPDSFTLNGAAGVTAPFGQGSANTEFCPDVPAGTYTVTEGADPPNFVLFLLRCAVIGPGSLSMSGRTVILMVAPGGILTCGYTNQLQTGAIMVTETRKHAAEGPGDHPQAGVSFTVNGVTKQTDANGEACFDGLLFGTYTVHETVPAGYHVDANDKSVTVDHFARCPFGAQTVTFHNTPLTDITSSVNSQIDGGTSSTIVCNDANGNTVASGSTDASGDGSATATGLEPGTYTCTIVIDP
jgi:Prealbumin-like fold domain